jgi:hypothetical protein
MTTKMLIVGGQVVVVVRKIDVAEGKKMKMIDIK